MYPLTNIVWDILNSTLCDDKLKREVLQTIYWFKNRKSQILECSWDIHISHKLESWVTIRNCIRLWTTKVNIPYLEKDWKIVTAWWNFILSLMLTMIKIFNNADITDWNTETRQERIKRQKMKDELEKELINLYRIIELINLQWLWKKELVILPDQDTKITTIRI